MLNIPDPWVAAALVLAVASSILCIVWGLLKWNEEEKKPETDEEVQHWAQEENKVEQEF